MGPIKRVAQQAIQDLLTKYFETMPIRIMYWNVNNFGKNRFFSDDIKRPRDGSGPSGTGSNSPSVAAQNRLNHLINNLTAGQAPGGVAFIPDIFIIVEVNTGSLGLPEGEILDEGSSYLLLDKIRANPILSPVAPAPYANCWCLVPPLVSGSRGRAEGIAVFYNSTKLQFIGPYILPAPPFGKTRPGAIAAGPASLGPAMEAIAPLPPLGIYEGFWGDNGPGMDPIPGTKPGAGLNCLPNRLVPGGHGPLSGVNENHLAGQFEFYNPPGTKINFPNPGDRSPFLTRFIDLTAVPYRIINLYSFHARPGQTPPAPGILPEAVAGTANLANVPGISGAIPANEVNVIAGDFNVSLFDTGGPNNANLAYGPLRNSAAAGGLGYTQHINPGAAVHTPTEEGYYFTHMIGQNSTVSKVSSGDPTPWNSPKTTGPTAHAVGYPAYGYAGTGKVGRYDAIDNIFTKYGGGAGAAGNITVVNRVTGTPYNLGIVPAGVPQGHYVYGVDMANGPASAKPALPLPPGAPVPPPPVPIGGFYPPGTPLPLPTPGTVGTDNDRKHFSAWENYGRIASTSDHMALVIDV